MKYTWSQYCAVVYFVGDTNTIVAIVVGAFKMEENIRNFVGTANVFLSDCKTQGRLMGPFAKAGKCKVEFNKTDLSCKDLLKEGSDISICIPKQLCLMYVCMYCMYY